jgi:iron(III) transport system ATP-binding protein
MSTTAQTPATIGNTQAPAERGSDDSAVLSGLSKSFASKRRTVDALKDIDLEVKRGEYVVVLGPSGCGKSTLIRCIAGLESPTEGTIHLNNESVFDQVGSVDVKPNARRVGMVFQNYALWPHMTVEQNVGYPLRVRKIPREQARQRVSQVLKTLECEQLAKRLPVELSGGQQQRIALARALVYEPSILLLDEPLSNLDALLRISLRSELLSLHRKLGFTAIHITHDQDEALEMGDRVVLMREGKIEQMGKPEEVYERPISPYAAVFLGVRNRVRGRVVEGRVYYDGGAIGGSEAVVGNATNGDEVELFVRGRDTNVVKIGTDGQTTTESEPGSVSLYGTVAQVVLGEGGRRQYIIDIGGAEWFAQHAAGTPAPGDKVRLQFPAAKALIYRDDRLLYPRS